MPIDIDNLNNQAPKVDNFLTSIENIWKKHWKLLSIIIISYGMYAFVKWVDGLPPVEKEVLPYDEQQYVQDSVYEDQDNYQYRDSIY